MTRDGTRRNVAARPTDRSHTQGDDMAPHHATSRDSADDERRHEPEAEREQERSDTPGATERRHGPSDDRPSQAEIDADPEAQAGPETS